MFSVLQQIKIAMSNKNDPYNYGQCYQQQMQGGQKNLIEQDSELDDIMSTPAHRSEENEEESKEDESESWMKRISQIFKPSEEENKWKEFPWEDIMVKTNVIKKWSKVDMKYINQLHTNFDTETGKFTNVSEDDASQ